MFVGPQGVGKRSFAQHLAQAMLCERTSDAELAACGTCPACRQVLAGNHPDVIFIQKPADKAFIPVELFIGDAEHRMRAGLCSHIALKPFSGRRKIAIIDDADYLNKEGANSLLKTLEEPPPKSLLILIGTSEQRQLPTIRSRCQVIRFGPLAEQDVAELLIEKGLCENRAAAAKAAASSQGSIDKARLWLDPAAQEFRASYWHCYPAANPAIKRRANWSANLSMPPAKNPRRNEQRLRHVVSMAAELYRAVLIQHHTNESSADQELASGVSRAASWMAGDDGAVACLEICGSATGAYRRECEPGHADRMVAG